MESDIEDFFPDIDVNDELPRLMSSAELLRNPFDENDRFADNVTITGKVSCHDDIIFIDISDDTPVALSSKAYSSVKQQFTTPHFHNQCRKW